MIETIIFFCLLIIASSKFGNSFINDIFFFSNNIVLFIYRDLLLISFNKYFVKSNILDDCLNILSSNIIKALCQKSSESLTIFTNKFSL